MAQIDNIVNVTVTKTSASVSRAGFGTPMGLFQIGVATPPDLFQLYGSPSEMLDAGYLVTDRAYLWASTVFSQDISPNQIAIGKRGDGTAQVDEITITTADPGTWILTLNGIFYSHVGGAGDEQAIAVGLADAINNGVPTEEPITASTPIAGVFTITSDIPGEGFLNSGLTLPGGGAGTTTEPVLNVPAEDMVTALAGIDVNNAEAWYLLNIETRNDADITAIAAYIAARNKVAVFQSKDSDAPAGVASNIFDTIAQLNNKRVALMWHDDDTEFVDGAWTGRVAAADLDAVGGAITWQGKQLIGVPTDNLTTGEVANILSYNGNTYTEIGGRGFVQNGTSAEGEFMDVQTTIDWTQARVQEAVFARIATTPTKVPYTNAGIGSIGNEVLGVLSTGVGIGHFSADQLPTVSVPTSSEVSEADKNARVLRNVLGTAKLAGAIHSTIVQVNVEV